jgi:choline-phosphate cytidylyltransferase
MRGANSHALQLRQAKLSFPTVHLMVGVFPDEICGSKVPHVERCELVRHCRWVDEVIGEAPFTVNEGFMGARKIDYVGVEEGISVDPGYDMVRVKAYDELKRLGED